MAASPVSTKPVCVIVRSKFYGRGKWSGGRSILPGTKGVLRGRLADGSAYIEFDSHSGTYHITREQLSCLELYGELPGEVHDKRKKDSELRFHPKQQMEHECRVLVKNEFYRDGKLHGGELIQVGTAGIVRAMFESGAYVDFEGHDGALKIEAEHYDNLIFLQSPMAPPSGEIEPVQGAVLPPRLEPNQRVAVRETFYGLNKIGGGGELQAGTKGIVKDLIVDAAYIQFEGHLESYCVTHDQYALLDVLLEATVGDKETEASNSPDESSAVHVPERSTDHGMRIADSVEDPSSKNGAIRERIDMIVDLIGDVVVGTHGSAGKKPTDADVVDDPYFAVADTQHAWQGAEKELKAPNGVVFKPACRVVAKDAFYSHGKWFGGAQLQPGTVGIVNEVLEDGVYVEFDGIYGTCYVTVDQLANLDPAPEHQKLTGEAWRSMRMRRLFEVDSNVEVDGLVEARSYAASSGDLHPARRQDPHLCSRSRLAADRAAEGRRTMQAMRAQRRQALQKLEREGERTTRLLEERATSHTHSSSWEVLRPNQARRDPEYLSTIGTSRAVGPEVLHEAVPG